MLPKINYLDFLKEIPKEQQKIYDSVILEVDDGDNYGCSYLLKCSYNGKYFLCNRNDTWYKTLMPEYLKWWEMTDITSLDDCNVELIMVVPYDNQNRRHQRAINILKDEYRKIDPDINEDEHICDIVLLDAVKNMKKGKKERYHELWEIYDKTPLKLYDVYRHEILSSPRIEELLDTPRYMLEKLNVKDEGKYAYLMVWKDSWKRSLMELKHTRQLFKEMGERGEPMEPIEICDTVGDERYVKTVYVPKEWMRKEYGGTDVNRFVYLSKEFFGL